MTGFTSGFVSGGFLSGMAIVAEKALVPALIGYNSRFLELLRRLPTCYVGPRGGGMDAKGVGVMG